MEQFNVNGQRASSNAFYVDGVSANFGGSVGANLYQFAGGSLGPGLTSQPQSRIAAFVRHQRGVYRPHETRPGTSGNTAVAHQV